MGQSAARKKAFYASHPVCAFCGGSAPSETVEHCPPRALFLNRKWPEGYEFPSCRACNSGSSDDDLIVAFLSRMDPFDHGDQDGKVIGLMKQLDRQHPGLLASMMPSPAEARRINRSLGISPSPGQSHQDTGAMRVPKRIDEATKRFGAKLSKAIYYKTIGQPFPARGEIAVSWFTNMEYLRHGHIPVFRALSEVAGVIPEHVRSSSLLNDQFAVKWSLSDDARVFALQAMFSRAFGFVAFGCVESGIISRKLNDLEAAGGPGPISLVRPQAP